MRNASAPSARRGRHLIPVASRGHVTAPAPGPRYYFFATRQLQPALYLRLNEPFGFQGNVFDSSPNFVNGTTSGTVTKLQAGPLVGDSTDMGYLFDGATGFVELGTPAALLPLFQNHDFTIEGWAKAVSATNYLFSYGLFNSLGPDQFLHFGYDGAGHSKLGFFGDDLNGALTVTTGVYHHMVATWSAATRLMSLYLDGMPDSSRVSGGPLSIPNGSDAQVARVAFGTGNGPFFYNGTLAELAIYPFVMTPALVNSRYLTGINAVPGVVPKITLEA